MAKINHSYTDTSIFKSGLKHSYFVGPLTSTRNRLSPASPKLRPYSAL